MNNTWFTVAKQKESIKEHISKCAKHPNIQIKAQNSPPQVPQPVTQPTSQPTSTPTQTTPQPNTQQTDFQYNEASLQIIKDVAQEALPTLNNTLTTIESQIKHRMGNIQEDQAKNLAKMIIAKWIGAPDSNLSNIESIIHDSTDIQKIFSEGIDLKSWSIV